jgi:hypothetical protein
MVGDEIERVILEKSVNTPGKAIPPPITIEDGPGLMFPKPYR